MPRIAKPPRLSAGAVIARLTESGWRYLLLRAYRNWDFPKGLVEAGEDALAAAIREVYEETGIGRLSFPWGSVYRETDVYKPNKIARYYLVANSGDKVRLPVSAELGRPEHHEFRWVTHVEARSLLAVRLHPIIDWAQCLISAGNRHDD